jgi:pyruvate,orthophosphate dikinase
VTSITTTLTEVDQYMHWFESPLQDRAALGGKGASLARMAGTLGLPVPPGFTITTDAWKMYADKGAVVPPELLAAVAERLAELGRRLGRAPEDVERPLLFSVRSGAPVSMPGMMDTVLNVGLNDQVVRGLAQQTSDRFALQSYLRLLSTYAEVVREVPAGAIAALEQSADNADEETMVERWKQLIAEHGDPFPQHALDQVREAIEAVWRSWDRPRARRYRRFRGISEDFGTAVTVQAMVFGNLDDDSGTGVVFTRDPGTGQPVLYGDFMRCAQGEDVVSGTMTPEPVDALREQSEKLWKDLVLAAQALEADAGDMCDVEFTVQHGELYVLQARPGQRSPSAAVRIAVEMVREGLIDVPTALRRVTLGALQQLQSPQAVGLGQMTVIATGVPASPGTGVGTAVFDSVRAEEVAEGGTVPVLLCPTTSPEDINGMIVASGIVTGRGGRASHAAVVARGMGKPAVCGVESMTIDHDARRATFASGVVISDGDEVTVDGNAGRLLLGAARFTDPAPDRWVAELLTWCGERSELPILEEAPAGAVPVGGPDDVLPEAGAVVVDVVWEGPDSASNLAHTCRHVFEEVNPAVEVFLALPAELAGIDFQPPEGRWAGVISPYREGWASRLLAARLSEPPPQVGGD